MKILGCDPGKASGLAVYDTDAGVALYMDEAHNGVQGFVPAFCAIYKTFRPDYIVCESFNLRPGNKFLADLSGVEAIGWLRGEGYKAEYVTPAQHKTLVPDAVLTPMMKDAGFPVGAGHTRDALRTAVWYAVKVLKHRPTIEKLKAKESN